MPYAADLRTLIRRRAFRRLFTTRVVSASADGVFQVGLAGFLLFSPEQQATASKAAIAAAILLLPYSLVGPFVGVFIDHWRRRQILVYAPLARTAIVGITAVLLATGHDGVPFYLAALAVLGVNRFFLSALSAGLPHVVRDAELISANAVSVTSGTFVTFAGAGLGYGLRTLFGSTPGATAGVLLCAAALYVAASVVASFIGRDELGPASRARGDSEPPPLREALEHLVTGFGAGARHMWHRRQATAAMAAIGAHRFLYGIMTIMIVLLFRNYFATNATEGLGGFAVALAASGIGYFLAAVVTPPVIERISIRMWITLQLAIAAAAELAFGAPFQVVPLVIGAFLLGLVAQGVKICADTTVQLNVDDAYRGRVFSFYDVLFNGLYVAGIAVSALILPPDGKSYHALLVIAGGYALAAVSYWTATHSLIAERLRRRPSPT